jgi:hypothetical protein
MFTQRVHLAQKICKREPLRIRMLCAGSLSTGTGQYQLAVMFSLTFSGVSVSVRVGQQLLFPQWIRTQPVVFELLIER